MARPTTELPTPPSSPEQEPEPQTLECHPPRLQARTGLPVGKPVKQIKRQRAGKRKAMPKTLKAPDHPSRSPTSATDRLANEFARCIDDYGLSIFPVVFVTAQLGHSRVTDAAATALVDLHRFSRPQAKKPTNPPSLHSYGEAIGLLRRTISEGQDGDNTLAAVKIVGIVDNLIKHQYPDTTTNKACSSHWLASTSILHTRPHKRESLSSLQRASLYAGPTRSFAAPCFTGIPSPFEDDFWLDVDPPSLDATPPPEWKRLRKLSHQLFTKLPRLICLARESTAVGATSEKLTTAIKSAHELVTLEDRDAEDWLLHQIRIVKTTSSEDCEVVPYSFAFNSLPEMDTAVCYWQTRLMAIRLYSSIGGEGASLENHAWAGGTLDCEELRIATNILMSWQYGLAHGPCGTLSLTIALAAVWGSLRRRLKYRHLEVFKVGLWVRKRLSQSWVGWIMGTTMGELDAACSVLAGGPIPGRMCALFNC